MPKFIKLHIPSLDGSKIDREKDKGNIEVPFDKSKNKAIILNTDNIIHITTETISRCLRESKRVNDKDIGFDWIESLHISAKTTKITSFSGKELATYDIYESLDEVLTMLNKK